MLPDSILPVPEDDIARILRDYERRLSHLERLENFESDIGARVFNSAAITIPNGANTIITFDSERFDTDGIHSTVLNTSRLTARTAGKYQISFTGRWNNNVTGRRLIRILLNGAGGGIAQSELNPDNNAFPAHSFSTLYELSVNDFVEIQIFQSSGGNLDVTFDPNISPEFMMIKVG